MKRSVREKTVYLMLCMLIAACAAFAWGCGDEASGGNEAAGAVEAASPDLTYYDNGYGTYFVTGTQIAHEADQSSSIAVDWSGSPEAKAPKGTGVTEEKGIVYSHSAVTDGRDKGKPLDLHMNLMYSSDPVSGQTGKDAGSQALKPVILLIPGGGFVSFTDIVEALGLNINSNHPNPLEENVSSDYQDIPVMDEIEAEDIVPEEMGESSIDTEPASDETINEVIIPEA